MDRHDVRMLDRCGRVGLSEEAPAEPFALRELGGQDFERDLPAESVLGEIYSAHAAPTE